MNVNNRACIKNFLSFCLIFFCYFIRYIQILFNVSNKYFTLYTIFVGAISIIILFKRKYNKKQLFSIAFASFFVVVLTLATQKIDFLIPLFLSLIYVKEDYKKVIKYILISSIILFFSAVVINFMGITESQIYTRLYNGVVSSRNSLGFPTPNSPFMHFLIIPLLLYCFSEKKFLYFLLLIFEYYLFYLTNCRTGFYVCTFFSLFVILVPEKFKKHISQKIPLIFIILTLISIFLTLEYKNFPWLDKILSYRLTYLNYNLNNYGISLFGNKNMLYTSDNQYIGLIMVYGIFSYAFYFFLYVFFSKYIYDYKSKILLIFFLIYGMFELNFNFYTNCSLFIILYFYFRKDLMFDEKN